MTRNDPSASLSGAHGLNGSAADDAWLLLAR
jgi:hypothetical protein